MKQLLQFAKNGEMVVVDLPLPVLRPGTVLVQNRASLVSAGTERTLVDFAEKNILQKAQSRPDLVQQVLDKVQRDGLLTTIETVRSRLDQPMALGYSSAGVVLGVDDAVAGFKVADQVACAGFGYAVHAEAIVVPQNLIAPIPSGVFYEEAAFTTVGAIALQGVRQATPQLGDNVAVIGLGLLGQLTIQLLKANGCRVFGIDLDPQRVVLAQELGIDAAVVRANAQSDGLHFTENHGFDAVLITADTQSNDPLMLAGELARDKGRVVAVGAVGMQVPRKIYYNKELDLHLSRSYGPGRYDPQYEEHGIDYPYGYVRWTENRNMQAFLHLVAEGKVDVKKLITHRFPIEQAEAAYDIITGKTKAAFLGVVLTYSENIGQKQDIVLQAKLPPTGGPKIRVGMIGAGSFAGSVLLPAMHKVEALSLRGICTATGVSSVHQGKQFGFTYACTDAERILNDPELDLVAIVTPHHLHAGQVVTALKNHKHVFCEKPLCLNEADLITIIQAYHQARDCHLMLGFNRRFAPLAIKLRDFIAQVNEPLLMHYRINGGYIPLDHWIQDTAIGGGRLVGEVCHFVDFMSFLTGENPQSVYAQALPNSGRYADDNLSLTLRYPNGSLGTITYAANGDKALGKERFEVFGGGRAAVLEDFRQLNMVYQGKRHEARLRLRQGKGHLGEWQALAHALEEGNPTPISFIDIVATTLVTLRAEQSLHSGEVVSVDSVNFVASAL
jgi:predicted dehydrogenase/threonine dehydrogenase-like Zn-dependent dehydrogenase